MFRVRPHRPGREELLGLTALGDIGVPIRRNQETSLNTLSIQMRPQKGHALGVGLL